MAIYTVRQTVQYPAWNERDGITFTVEASSKADAIQRARREAWDLGLYGGEQGRRTFKVVSVETE